MDVRDQLPASAAQDRAGTMLTESDSCYRVTLAAVLRVESETVG